MRWPGFKKIIFIGGWDGSMKDVRVLKGAGRISYVMGSQLQQLKCTSC